LIHNHANLTASSAAWWRAESGYKAEWHRQLMCTVLRLCEDEEPSGNGALRCDIAWRPVGCCVMDQRRAIQTSITAPHSRKKLAANSVCISDL
jgi:hypothetical protein